VSLACEVFGQLARDLPVKDVGRIEHSVDRPHRNGSCECSARFAERQTWQPWGCSFRAVAWRSLPPLAF